MNVNLIKNSSSAVHSLKPENESNFSKIKSDFAKADNEIAGKLSKENGIAVMQQLDTIADQLASEEDANRAKINEQKSQKEILISEKKTIQKYIPVDNTHQQFPWNFSSFFFLMLGLFALAFFSLLEVIAISTLLELYVPGFAGENLFFNRIALGLISIMLCISLKYAVESHESHRLKSFTRNLAMVAALIFLSLFFTSFFGSQLFGAFFTSEKQFDFGIEENIVEIISISRMILLFLASFCGAFLVSEIPAREIKARSRPNQLNQEYQATLAKIGIIKATIKSLKTEIRQIKRFLKKVINKRKRLYRYLLNKVQRDAVLKLEAQINH